jgi:hypothetical protein
VFPVRYELDFYISFRGNSVFRGLIQIFWYSSLYTFYYYFFIPFSFSAFFLSASRCFSETENSNNYDSVVLNTQQSEQERFHHSVPNSEATDVRAQWWGVILVCGIYHNDPLLPSHPAAPISLAVVWDVILNRQNNTLISETCYCCHRTGSRRKTNQFSSAAQKLVSTFTYKVVPVSMEAYRTCGCQPRHSSLGFTHESK